MKKLLLPLMLIRAGNGEIRGRTRLQKMVFLYQNEERNPLARFNFIPWNYGPYSKELQGYLDTLVELGLVGERPIEFGSEGTKEIYEYRLTKRGEQFLHRHGQTYPWKEAEDELSFLHEKWDGTSLEGLLEYVYSRYPHYASRSELTP